jgi:hypothetical protein
VAKELGYSLEAADLRQAMSDIEELDDLSDEALEGVSGGLLSLSSFSRPSLLGRASLPGLLGRRPGFGADSAF